MSRSGCILAIGLVFLSQVCRISAATDQSTAPRVQGVDYPLSLIAFASIDRLQTRAATLAQAVGLPGQGDSFLKAVADDDDVGSLAFMPGLDLTRPIGAMSYPKWLDQSTDGDGTELDFDELASNPFNFVLTGLAEGFMEDATIVLCLPVKNRDELLASVQNLLDKDRAPEAIPDKPGWYQFSKGDDVQLGFVGHYLLVVVDDGDQKRFDRNYPEFDQLAKSSLGKNGFVFAAYRRGLPPLVRDVMAPAFKLLYAARFQRQDGEPEMDFRLRTMFGSTQMELLDLVLSHIDEFRISGHVDSRSGTIQIETELVGPKNGKLAKYCNSAKLKGNPFAALPTDSAVVSGWASFPLPEKAWKPVSESLFQQAASFKMSAIADVLRTLATTLESGQFDLFTVHPDWNAGLVAVRVTTNSRLPESFQQMLKDLQYEGALELAADSIEEIPIHRTRTTLGSSPLSSLFSLLVQTCLGQFTHVPGIGQPGKDREIEYSVVVTVEENGVKRTVVQTKSGTQPAGSHFLWIAATPTALWLGVSEADSDQCPDWFKTQLAASLTRSSRNSPRSKLPFGVTVRGLGANPPAGIELASGIEVASKTPEAERARGDVLRDLPNAIHAEVVSSETGVKLKLRFEEAYFHWFAAVARDLAEEKSRKKPSAPSY